MSLLNAFTTTNIVLCAVAGVLVILAVIIFCMVPMKTWFTALVSGAPVSMHALMGMRFRKVKYVEIVNAYVSARKSKLKIKLADLEALYLAGGNCNNVVTALASAKAAGLDVDFDFVRAVELAKHNPIEVIEEAVTPRTILINNISVISQDNIEVIASVRATIKVNLNNYLGGTSEETLKSKIQKGVLANIALSPNHKLVLASPNKILTGILGNGIDDECAYKLISLEVAKIELGRDVGAEMASKNAQREIAQAQVDAERAKNDAYIREQQLRAKAEEMKSTVLAAEAEVPKAIAEAIKEGRFSIMDYYKLMNLQADTAMRRSIMKDKKEEA